MALANIVVHLDTGARTAARLAIAVRLAARDGARLTGLFAEMSGAHRVGVVASWPSAEHVAAVAAARAVFEAATRDLGERAVFVDVNRGGEQEILARATDYVCTFDLVILGQTEEGSRVPPDLLEQIIQESGRPVLVVPYAGTYEDLGRRPLFAWHRSRGAARALHDALPLVAAGAEALVVEAGRPGEAIDRFEGETLAFHRNLRQAYLDIASAEPQRCAVLDATLPPEALAEAAWHILRERLPIDPEV